MKAVSDWELAKILAKNFPNYSKKNFFVLIRTKGRLYIRKYYIESMLGKRKT